MSSRMLLATAVAVFATAGSAQADYLVHSCALPDGSPAGLVQASHALQQSGWEYRGDGFADTTPCAQAGEVFWVGPTPASGSRQQWSFAAPPYTALTSWVLHRQITRPGTQPARYSLWVRSTGGWGRGRPVEHCIGPERCSALPAVATGAMAGKSHRYLTLGQRCARKAGCDAGQVAVSSAQFRLTDLRAPKGTWSGSLRSKRYREAVREAVVSATDQGVGLWSAQMIINGQTVSQQRFQAAAACADAWPATPELDVLHPQPCPRSGQLRFSLDVGALPPGQYHIAFEITDAAGGRRQLSPRRRLVVAAPADPAAQPSSISLFWRRQPEQSMRVSDYGSWMWLHGRIASTAGPIGNAAVEILRNGRVWRRARSAADGSFRLRVRATSNSQIQAQTAQGTPVRSGVLQLQVRASIATRVHRSKRLIRISGTASPHLDGKQLQVQVRKDAPGYSYQTVGRARVRSGRWRMSRPVQMPRGRFQVRARYAASGSETISPAQATVVP